MYVSKEEIEAALDKFREKRPDNAEQTFTKRQLVFAASVTIAFLAALWLEVLPTLIGFIAICVVGFTTLSIAKTFLTHQSVKVGMMDFSPSEITSLRDEDLPSYTIFVPLMGEESVVKELVESLSKLDYPVDKLQIMLLLEERDPNTIKVVRNMVLPNHFEVYLLADVHPRTKPKACTIALQHARGDICVVYDAEDKVEPDQLKKVVLGFRRVGQAVWCIQAKLEYHNVYQNVLTRLFSGEYVTYFNLILPGLANNNLLVPLGGTSNHFRTYRLQQMAGWDPWNVTEDLDLGVVIKRYGANVQVVNSVTWEEANYRLNLFTKGGWTAQRSRWIKGPMQVYLIHMRNPIKLFKELGLVNFLFFNMLVGGTPFALLLSPVFLLVTAVYVLSRTVIAGFNPEVAVAIQLGIETLFPSALLYLGVLSFTIGNALLVYYALWGCIHRELFANAKWMLLAPLYWLLMSVAAWKAFIQLVRNPHYWEKSQHGASPMHKATSAANMAADSTVAISAISNSEGD